MRRILIKFDFVMVALLMFCVGFLVDSYLRRQNPNVTDCYCMSFKCRIVFVADNPMIVLQHPVEVLKSLTYWE